MNNVIHPEHYNKNGRKECWDEMLELFGHEAVIIFDCLNAYKYHYRAGEKSGNPKEQDEQKMKNYVDHSRMLYEKYEGIICDDTKKIIMNLLCELTINKEK